MSRTARRGMDSHVGQASARRRGRVMTTTASGRVLAALPPGIALLEDKLRIPRPGVKVLSRPRVGELLDAAVTRRVTLLTGPPGAGKTVAAALWAAGRPGGRPPTRLADNRRGRRRARPVLAVRHRSAAPGRGAAARADGAAGRHHRR